MAKRRVSGRVAEAAVIVPPTDRHGLSWRGELAAGILTHLDQHDRLEVIVDDYLNAGRAQLDGLVTLARGGARLAAFHRLRLE